MNVWCVLRSGGRYDARWVERLYNGVRRHWDVSDKLRFVCLTDMMGSTGKVLCYALQHDWPGWWSKLELWRNNFPAEEGLYLDLDSVVTGPMSAVLAHRGRDEFTAMRGAVKAELQSAVMLWSQSWMLGTGRKLYAGMTRNAGKVMGDNPWGDQQYIERTTHAGRFTFECVSYRDHVLYHGVRDASVVQFHGEPKMDQLGASDALRLAWEDET